MEVSVAIIIKENTGDGALISVFESETAMPPSCSGRGTEQQQTAELYEQVFGTLELQAATTVERVKDKALEQIRVHAERVRDGSHPMFH